LDEPNIKKKIEKILYYKKTYLTWANKLGIIILLNSKKKLQSSRILNALCSSTTKEKPKPSDFQRKKIR
jgi:hypothetical protein